VVLADVGRRDRSPVAHVLFKTAPAVSEAMSLPTPFAACVHTLTTNNEKEFAQHERIAKEFGADFFVPIPMLLGAWCQREHERPHPAVLPEGDGP